MKIKQSNGQFLIQGQTQFGRLGKRFHAWNYNGMWAYAPYDPSDLGWNVELKNGHTYVYTYTPISLDEARDASERLQQPSPPFPPEPRGGIFYNSQIRNTLDTLKSFLY